LRLRSEVAARYQEQLADIVQTPWISEENRSVYAQYTIELEDREYISNALKQEGIPSSVHYPLPAHLQSAFLYLGYADGDFPLAERAADRVLSLPMHPYLKIEDQDKICGAVRRAVAGAGAAARL
jgi:UDP-2-acetamido-2-deoxy-ribo-hexuluronate aminotransferase